MVEASIANEESDRISEFVQTPEGEVLFHALQEAKGRGDKKAFDDALVVLRQKALAFSLIPADGVVVVDGVIKPAKPKPQKRVVYVPDTYRFVRSPSPTPPPPPPSRPSPGLSSLLPDEQFDVNAASLGLVGSMARDTEKTARRPHWKRKRR